MKAYVIDASLLLQALLGESLSVQSRLTMLFNPGNQVFAPDMLKVEFRNGLRYSLDSHESYPHIINAFSRLPIEFFSIDDVTADEALSLAHKYDVTVYDALYHCLALQLKATYLTCDKKYYRAAKLLGGVELVQ